VVVVVVVVVGRNGAARARALAEQRVQALLVWKYSFRCEEQGKVAACEPIASAAFFFLFLDSQFDIERSTYRAVVVETDSTQEFHGVCLGDKGSKPALVCHTLP